MGTRGPLATICAVVATLSLLPLLVLQSAGQTSVGRTKGKDGENQNKRLRIFVEGAGHESIMPLGQVLETGSASKA
jgi:hypothetical protein